MVLIKMCNNMNFSVDNKFQLLQNINNNNKEVIFI